MMRTPRLLAAYDHEVRHSPTWQQGYEFAQLKGEKLNLGCGDDLRPAAEGWVNMDGFVPDARIVRHDLLRTPWPFTDDRFSLVYACHVLEHVPVVVGAEGKDVLLSIFDECWRVLRPGGRLVVRVPLGGTDAGLRAMNHYRQFHPGWFTMLSEKNAGRWDASSRYWRIVSLRVRDEELCSWKLPRLRVAGLPLSQHVAIRAPALRGYLCRGEELEAVLEKPRA